MVIRTHIYKWNYAPKYYYDELHEVPYGSSHSFSFQRTANCGCLDCEFGPVLRKRTQIRRVMARFLELGSSRRIPIVCEWNGDLYGSVWWEINVTEQFEFFFYF